MSNIADTIKVNLPNKKLDIELQDKRISDADIAKWNSGGGGEVPLATDTTPGIAKLYSETGTNTDGSVTQDAITTALDGKQNTLSSSTSVTVKKVTCTGVASSGDLEATTTSTSKELGFYAKNGTNNCKLLAAQNSGIWHTADSGYKTAGWIVYMTTAGKITTNTTSDRRQKDFISELSEEEALALLKEVNPILFTYKSDAEEAKLDTNVGFYAQDIRDCLKRNNIGYRSYLLLHKGDEDVYDLDHDENEIIYGIDYAKLVPVLWKGWQEHENKISKLENEIAELKAMINKG